MKTTDHLKKRMQQRGRNSQDLMLIDRFGKKISPDIVIMRKIDCATAADTLKSEFSLSESKPMIQRLDHLAGWRLICDKGTGITIYNRQKKLARARNKHCKHSRGAKYGH